MTLKTKKKSPKQSRRKVPTKPVFSQVVTSGPSVISEAADEKFSWFVVTVFAACFWFANLLLVSNSWPAILPKLYYKIFAATLFGVLPLSLLTSVLLLRLRRTFLADNENFLPALIALQTPFWAWVWTRPTTSLMSAELLGTVRMTVPLLVLTASGLALFSGQALGKFWAICQRVALVVLAPLSLTLLWHFKADVVVGGWTLVGFALLAFFATYLVASDKFLGPGLKRDKWDIVTGIIVVLTVISTGPYTDFYHQNCFIGPANAVLHGRNMLSDVLCEYGVANIYFLAFLFKILGMKPTYVPLSFLLMLMTVLFYLSLYWVARKTFRSRFLAFLCVAVIFCLSRCGSFALWDNIAYPSVGPLRFFLPLLVLMAGFQRRTKASRNWAWTELGLLGLSSIWSVETFVYCLSAWGFSTGAEAVALSTDRIDFFKRVLRHIGGLIVAIAIAYAGLTLFTLIRSGDWLHWQGYLSWLTFYSGASTWPLNLWSPFVLLPGVACLSLLASALLNGERTEQDASNFLIFGAAGAAAAEFSYFIVRSHPNNLGHIAPLYILVFFFWLDRAWSRIDLSGVARWTMTPVAFFVVISLLWNASESISGRFDQSLLVWLSRQVPAVAQGSPLPIPNFFKQIWNPTPISGPSVGASVELIKRYAPNQKRIAIFAPYAVEVYALSDTDNVFPIADIDEERWVRPFYNAEAAGPLPLKVGDVMLVGQDANGGFNGPPLLQDNNGIDLGRILDVVRKHFKLVPLEPKPFGGIWVIRLEPLDASPIVQKPVRSLKGGKALK